MAAILGSGSSLTYSGSGTNNASSLAGDVIGTSGGTIPLLNGANTASALWTFSNAPGTGSGAYGVVFTGAPQTSSLYNPVVYISGGGTTPTFGTGGNMLTVNSPSGFAGYLYSGYTNGSLEYDVSSGGTGYFNASVIIGQTGEFQWNARSNFSSPSTGLIDIGTGSTAGTGGSLSMTNSTESGTNNAALYATATNCSSSASPAVCGSAAAGSVLIPTGTTSSTLTVNTTAVTANSQIFFYPDDTLGTKLGSITCNSTLATLVGGSAITARTAGTSFQITFNGTIATNGVCGSYLILN
jgi:hypothetical protein